MKKFGKNRSVSFSYAKIPLFYTGIKHPNNKNKELVLMDKYGKRYIACWRNDKTNKIGRMRLISATSDGFIFKDKKYRFKNLKKSFVI